MLLLLLLLLVVVVVVVLHSLWFVGPGGPTRVDRSSGELW